jgi:hypothetical protein
LAPRLAESRDPNRAKFVELAQKRMHKAIKAIGLVGQLDRHRNGYEHVDIMLTLTFLARH